MCLYSLLYDVNRLAMHEESSTRRKVDDNVHEGAVPAYLLDRETTARAKASFLYSLFIFCLPLGLVVIKDPPVADMGRQRQAFLCYLGVGIQGLCFVCLFCFFLLFDNAGEYCLHIHIVSTLLLTMISYCM